MCVKMRIIIVYLEIGECSIMKGIYGQIMSCPKNTIATSSCGSGFHADCGFYQNYKNLLQCCKVRPNVKGNLVCLL